MRYFIALAILVTVVVAVGAEKDLRVACYTDSGELIVNLTEDEFMKMESGSMPDGYTCEVYDSSLVLYDNTK